jgi:ParB-like chromosome segregation protein Spo0J
MKVEYLSPDELVPYGKNAKEHPPAQVERIANSIKRFGWQQPIVVDRNKVVIIGHGRLAAAKLLNLDKVPVKFEDDLTDAQVKALRLADNKTNESDWSENLLAEELAELDIDGIDMSEFGFENVGDLSEIANPYTGKVKIPQYEPTGEDPPLEQLVDQEKTNDLLKEIDESSVSDEEKAFLRLAAQRHLAFNYKKVAEYYANASEEMQELMEKSALVIIDYDDAIAYGYTRLNSSVREMFDDVEE